MIPDSFHPTRNVRPNGIPASPHPGGSTRAGEPLRVHGQVVAGSIERDDTGLVHKFLIEEGGKTVPVVYYDLVPDTFEDLADAVVEGSFAAAGTFQATFLMAKCPSKYEAETDYAQFRQAGVAVPAQGQ